VRKSESEPASLLTMAPNSGPMAAPLTKPKKWRLRVASMIAPLALLILAAGFVAAIAIFFQTAQSGDERHELSQRETVRGAAQELRPGHPISDATKTAIEQRAAVTGLAWTPTPDAPEGGVVQSVLDDKGRILGWLTWDAQRPLTALFDGMLPFFAALAAGLAAVAALVLWQSRRLLRGLSATEKLRVKLEREDQLTGLASDRVILETVERTLAARAENKHVGFLLIDLDGFWELNDSLGRDAGDALLIAAAERIAQLAPADSVVGRFGGDKFAVVANFAEAQDAQAMAAYFVAEMIQPYLVNGHGMQIGATAGVAIAPGDGLSRDEIVRHAGLALRSAKAVARGSTWTFRPEFETELRDRRFIERELKRALADEALDVHYQPIVSAQDSSIVGVEALLRWNHPTRGFIPPMSFVPIAERTGIMGELGEFVLRRAFKDATRWPDLSIAVNLSPVQLQSCAIVRLMAAVVQETGLDPKRVIVEITEGVLVREPKKMSMRLEKLRGLGFKIALDDFGAGYSNLSYLQRLPFDVLKIDGSFVAALNRSANAGVLIQAMVTLGRALDLRVLIEGVETEEQRLILRLAGCDEMQGYLFSKAVPREQIDTMVAALKGRGGGLPLIAAPEEADRTRRPA
jgi:diguanylate cyclase (GGDEF)-like protein